MLVLRLPRFATAGIGSTVHGVERKSYGELFLALCVGFLFFFSLGKPVLYVLPIAVLTLSDAAAALIGTRYGRRHFQVEAGTKSLRRRRDVLPGDVDRRHGAAAADDRDRAASTSCCCRLLIAAFGALVEADSWRGFDNLFVPVGIHLFLANHLATPPAAAAAADRRPSSPRSPPSWRCAPALTLTRHAARAYTVLVFLICLGDGAAQRHPAGARRAAPISGHGCCGPAASPYPDLDLIAVVERHGPVLAVRRRIFGHNALNVYNLTFAGAALVFLALLARGATCWPLLAAAAWLAAAADDLLIAQLESWPAPTAVARRALALGRGELRRSCLAVPGLLLAAAARPLPRAARPSPLALPRPAPPLFIAELRHGPVRRSATAGSAAGEAEALEPIAWTAPPAALSRCAVLGGTEHRRDRPLPLRLGAEAGQALLRRPSPPSWRRRALPRCSARWTATPGTAIALIAESDGSRALPDGAGERAARPRRLRSQPALRRSRTTSRPRTDRSMPPSARRTSHGSPASP